MTSEEIKQEYSMKDIVGRYGLIPNRSGFIACPFHKGDRTPSLKVYGKDFHCHSCGAHGDIFDFVQMMDEVSFKTAFQSLGGTYEAESPKAARIRKAEAWKEKARRMEDEMRFQRWRADRLGEACRLLRLLDEAIPGYEPFSGEWEAAIQMREANRYKYDVLASGTRAEQEEMRALDE